MSRFRIKVIKNEFFNPSNEPETVKNDVKTTPKTEIKISKNEQNNKVESSQNKAIVYKIQISTGIKNLATTPSNFKGLKNISKEESGKLFKYFYGSEASFADAKSRLSEAKQKGFTSSFIVAYKDGIKISVSDAIK